MMRNKKFLIPLGICLIVITVVVSAVWFSPRRVNSRAFEKTLQEVYRQTTKSAEITLTDLTPFSWDTVYFFGGYTDTATIDKTIGFKSRISPTYQESDDHLVFVKNDKIVCHLETADTPCYFSMTENKAISPSEAKFKVTKTGSTMEFYLIKE